MKKVLFFSILFLAVAGLTASAQEPRFEFHGDSIRGISGFTRPDSLAHLSPWRPETRSYQIRPVKPLVSMTSVVAIDRGRLPKRVTVLNSNALHLGERFNLSNGQAWNWSPFPDAYLDARTLSFPLPR